MPETPQLYIETTYTESTDSIEMPERESQPAVRKSPATIALQQTVEPQMDLLAHDDEPDEKMTNVTMSSDPVKDYLRSIGKVELLRADQEVELAMAIEVGLMAGTVIEERTNETDFIGSALHRELLQIQHEGKRSQDHLLTANLRLVVSIAKRYAGRGMDFLELIQEGNVGLIRAVEKYDYKLGFKFSTYATWWIQQQVTRSLADLSRTIRIPVHTVEIINKARGARTKMIVDLQREPTMEELAQELDLPTEKLTEIMNYDRQPISLNMKMGDDGDTEIGEIIGDDGAISPIEGAEVQDFTAIIHTYVDTLPELERDIIRRRYGFEGREVESVASISQTYGYSQERVRQIEARARRKLAVAMSKDQKLQEYHLTPEVAAKPKRRYT